MKKFDVIVIGSGPAGQKAAVQAAKAGKTIALVERDQWLGGACVHRGTIPSKTLRENALRVKKMRENAALCSFELAEDTEMSTLIDRLNRVLKAHDGFMVNQIERNHIVRIHGRAKFLSPIMQRPIAWQLLDSFIAFVMFTLAIKMAQAGGWLQ